MAFVRAKTYKKKKFKHSRLRDSSISCDSRKIHCLTREFHVKLNVKFTCQAMDFPIEVTALKSLIFFCSHYMTLFVTSVRCHRTMYLYMLGAYDAIRDVSTMPSYYVSHMLGAYDAIRDVSTMPSYYVSHMLGAYDAIRDVSTMPSYYVSHMLGAYDAIREYHERYS